MSKNINFYYDFHIYPLSKAGLAAGADAVNLDITDDEPCKRRRQSGLVAYEM